MSLQNAFQRFDAISGIYTFGHGVLVHLSEDWFCHMRKEAYVESKCDLAYHKWTTPSKDNMLKINVLSVEHYLILLPKPSGDAKFHFAGIIGEYACITLDWKEMDIDGYIALPKMQNVNYGNTDTGPDHENVGEEYEM